MNVRLTVTRRDQPGPAQESRTEVFDLDKILLGRDPGSHVVLPLQAVSRSHACITRDGDIYYIEDSGSAFGTQVNHESLPLREKRRLYTGDIIAIAQFDLLFEVIAATETGPHVAPKVIIVSNPYLRMMNGPNEGTRIEIEEGREYIVGRTQEAQVFLNTDLVSRKHAKLRRDLGGTHVEDLESRNGTRLNHKPIRLATLSDGDELEIGGIKMLYIDLDNPKAGRFAFEKPEAKTPPPKEKPPGPPKKPPPPPEPEQKEAEPPPEEAPPPETPNDSEFPAEPLEKTPPPPLFKGKQAIVLLAIGGGAALIALIFLILVFVGA
ncbi:MAG: FHA domain-containing protein [Cystobacterineae bacterium]|nr:FHA domain-containing protein [Cystobacterineae bacterium]